MAATTASLSMNAKPANRWSSPIKVGLLGGTVAIYLSLVGILTALANRAVITGVISLGQVILLGVYIMFGYMAAQRAAAGQDKAPSAWCLVSGALAGLITSAFLVALVVIAPIINLREIFINASPELWDLLTFGLGVPDGSLRAAGRGSGRGSAVGRAFPAAGPNSSFGWPWLGGDPDCVHLE